MHDGTFRLQRWSTGEEMMMDRGTLLLQLRPFKTFREAIDFAKESP